MVRITEELVRKKSEHNEGIISTLEELSLHQEDVEKIEHLNNWCKDLQILYLQANLISKIENLNKLKKLQYLNLALNNIEKVENLERCESLEKLDLTLNFIGDIESVCSLKQNIYLRDLYLTGNPCCDFNGYRSYVVAKLPHLENLDNVRITKSEKIKARQNIDEIERGVLEAQINYTTFRQEQRERLRNVNNHIDDETFWKTTSENSPETRVEISKRARKNRGKNDDDDSNNKVKRSVRLFHANGRPLNVNQAKLDFKFCDEDPKQYVLDVAVYKYLDTSLVDVDVQPIYVKITIKGKIFQFVLPEEVHTDKSTAQRSQTTGHLVIKMPRFNYKTKEGPRRLCNEAQLEKKPVKTSEFLEVEGKRDDLDFSNIVEGNKNHKIDDADVPPLEYGL